ncbi:MAG TPA: F0F1 ATP synthase subunit gamma [Vicinamibacterales bacterium]|nr:F0F1 ATP synthase subunit gamma [Vicinamibacterales bacterium]
METLEQLSQTLESLDDLRSIVRTMKALAAASIRQYERAVESLEHYSRTVDLGLHVVLREMPEPMTSSRRTHGPIGVVVFGSDHGLCGRFNEELAGFVHEHVRARAEAETVRVLVIGARMTPLIEASDLTVDSTLPVPGSAARITALVDKILLTLDTWQAKAAVVGVHLFYNRRRARSRLHPTAQRLLPVDLRHFRRLEEEPWPSRVLPTFSMDRERLFTALVRQYLFVSLFRACTESQAAEHASRLSAMQSASRNLDDRQTELIAEFRRRRQEVITAELLDVVSGYQALSATRRNQTSQDPGSEPGSRLTGDAGSAADWA